MFPVEILFGIAHHLDPVMISLHVLTLCTNQLQVCCAEFVAVLVQDMFVRAERHIFTIFARGQDLVLVSARKCGFRIHPYAVDFPRRCGAFFWSAAQIVNRFNEFREVFLAGRHQFHESMAQIAVLGFGNRGLVAGNAVVVVLDEFVECGTGFCISHDF